MQPRTFGSRVTLLLTLALATTLSVAAALYVLLHASETSATSQQDRLVATKNTAYRRLEALNEMQNQLGAMLRLKDPDELEQALARYEATLAGVRDGAKPVAGNASDSAVFSRLEALTSANRQAIDRLLLGEAGGAFEILVTHVGPAHAALLAAIRADNDEDERTLTAAATAAAEHRQRWVRLALTGCAVLLLLFTAYGLHFHRTLNRELRKIAGHLNDAARQVSAAAGQVSSASQSLAEGSSAQAASLEETSASVEEITSMTRRNADSADHARTLAGETRHATDLGSGQMQEMVAAMNDIKTSSDNIAKIIKTIDEIAFQTNILALNAAVEAARAGEAGAGFAVVADEVRNLAQRAAQAARETAEKIDDAIRKSAQGVQVSGKVADSLKDIAAKTHQVNDLVVEIATASKEQMQGLGQIGTAMGQMDKVTQSNAANSEETAAAAAELNAQASALLASVGTLQSLIGTATDRVAPAPQPTVHASAKPAGTPVPASGHDDFFKSA